MFRRPYRSGCVGPIVSGNSCTVGNLDAISFQRRAPAGVRHEFHIQFTVCVSGRPLPAQLDTPPFRSGDIQHVGHQMTGVGLHALVDFP